MPSHKVSDTESLARWFRTEVQKQPWDYNHPTCRMLLREAKNYVNPTEGQKIPINRVQRAVLLAVQERRRIQPGFVPNNLCVITWKSRNGKSYYDEANDVPPSPPMYERLPFLWWLDNYGEQIFPQEQLAQLRGMIYGG